MLQRQMMFKQLQEMQRKQQLQELGNNRNQNYVPHQLSPVKQASGVQFPSMVNEKSVQNSPRTCMFDNSQMMQHYGPSGFLLSQNHNLAPQLDVPNADESRNQSTFDGSFMSQRYIFSSDQTSKPDGSFVSSQENNLFGQIRAGGFNSGVLSGNYPQQGFIMHKNASFQESEKGDKNGSSLDPLERKILYNTDDNSWESAFSRIGKMNSGGFGKTVEMPSMQSGRWSALMESAVAESSSSDAGIQEEWSGLSFQNPEPLNESEKLQNGWVDKNLQNASSPSSKPEDMVQSINSFTNSQQSAQYHKQEEEYQTTRGNHLIQESLHSENIWPGEHSEHKEHSDIDAHQPNTNFSGHEFRGSFWSQGSTSDHVSGIQKYYNQMNRLNNRGHSVKPENMIPVGVSNGENVTAPSENIFELLNKDDNTSNDQTSAVQLSSRASVPRIMPDASSASPDFRFRMGPTNPQGISSATPLSNHIASDYIKYSARPVDSHVPTEFAASQRNSEMEITKYSVLGFPLLGDLPESQPSLTSEMLQHARFAAGLPTPWPENQNSFRNEYQQLRKGDSVREDSTGINNSTSLSGHEHGFKREHKLEANAVESGPSITNTHEQASSQAEVKKEAPSLPARDNRPFHHPSNQNYSPVPRVLSTRNDETGDVKNFHPKNDYVNNQQSVANTRKLLLSGLQSGVNDRAKGDLHALSHLGAFWSGKPSSMSDNQNSQNSSSNRLTSSNDTSSLTYKSHVSSQMASSWFKHYETLKNEQILPMYDARAANNAPHPFDEMTCGKLQENSLITQANLVIASQESGLCPSTAAASVACKQLTCVLPSDDTCQNSTVPMPKKRNFAMLMVPWHKELNYGQTKLQDTSTAEHLWAEVSNRKPEEANNESDIVEKILPTNQTKRRLISTTQLMQQVFRPAPVIILCSDASINCDSVAYFSARLALGDAWSLTYTNNMSPDKLKSSKRTKGCDFSKVVEAFIDRVKKVEADLSRLDKSLSIVDVKLEARELEKFSTINRFANFHIRAHPVNVEPASSSGATTLLKGELQKHIVPLPMPKIIPEGQECLSL